MGQVPERATFVLIGDGRLATHLSTYFQAKNLNFIQWSRRQGVLGPSSSTLFEPAMADERDPERSLAKLLASADRVLLAIRDDALGDFVRAQNRNPAALWVHFSGSRVIDGAWSAHPLSTFAGAAYPLAVYETIPFIIEQEGPPLAELLPGLDNPSATLPRAAKPLYHALSVAAGNFTQMLWQQLFRTFEEHLGLDADVALPYLRQTARNLEQAVDQESVLTGPIARGDQGTIRSNINALRSAQLDALAEVYEAFLGLTAQKSLEVA